MNLLDSNPPREHFTKRCADYFNVFVPVDEISNDAIDVYQRRGDMFEILIGLHNATSYAAIRCAEVKTAA